MEKRMVEVVRMVESLSLRLSDAILAGREGNHYGSSYVESEVWERLDSDLEFFGKLSCYPLYHRRILLNKSQNKKTKPGTPGSFYIAL